MYLITALHQGQDIKLLVVFYLAVISLFMLEIYIFLYLTHKTIRGQCYIRTERRHVALPTAVVCASPFFFFIREGTSLTNTRAALYKRMSLLLILEMLDHKEFMCMTCN